MNRAHSAVCRPRRAQGEEVRAEGRALDHLILGRMTEIACIPCVAKHRAYVSIIVGNDPCDKESYRTYTSASPSPYLMSPLS